MVVQGAGDRTMSSSEVTQLLHSWRSGSEEALEQLVPLVYDELRRIAQLHMRGERSNHTLQPTALVNQAYERLLGLEVDWADRAHFLNMASRTMRRVLVDHARARRREKRGGDRQQVTLDDGVFGPVGEGDGPDLVELDDALTRLAEIDTRKADVLQAHYFGGLGYRELAEAFSISEATVHRELRMARAWLGRELG